MTTQEPKVLLVVIAITPWYLDLYSTIFRRSHELYAKKHGYDFRIVSEMLDYTVNHTSAFSFQKILVCSQDWSKDYDIIVCIDADIFINPNSPPIHNYCDWQGKIGIVDEYGNQEGSPSGPSFRARIAQEGTPTDYYQKVPGLDIETKMELNTGVMVFQPRLHADFLRKVFDKYVRGCMTSDRGFHYEQSTVGYELQKNNLYTLLPNKFNALWGVSKYNPETAHISLLDFYQANYFIHFAGNVDWFEVPPVLHKYI
jgi:hypothetical protein